MKKRHKLLIQGIAFSIMMVVPLLLYWSAQKGYEGATIFLLGVMAGGMIVAVWVS
jgi:hypothetical protein